MTREHLKTAIFRPYGRGKGPVFTIKLYDTFTVDRLGKPRLAYTLHMRNGDHNSTLLFEGDDFCCSPLHAVDSDETIKSLMHFLTLRPGDTDAEYFESYTPAQKAYCTEHAESLYCAVCDRYGWDD